MNTRCIAWIAAAAAAGACSSTRHEEAPLSGSAPVTPAAPSAKHRIGPIDLDAPEIDLAALFPRDRVSRKAPDQRVVHRPGFDGPGGDIALVVDVTGDRVTHVDVLAPGIATSLGIEAGAQLGKLAHLAPEATCIQLHDDELRDLATCDGHDGFSYMIRTAWTGDHEVPIAELGTGEIVGFSYDWQHPGPHLVTRKAVGSATTLSAEACARLATTLLARTFGSRLEDAEAHALVEDECTSRRWSPSVETCVGGPGDPWRCVEPEVAALAGMPFDPNAVPGINCADIDAHASGWGFTGKEASEQLVQSALRGVLWTACTKEMWRPNVRACWASATDPSRLPICAHLMASGGDALLAQTQQLVDRANGWAKLAPIACADAGVRFYTAAEIAKAPMPRYTAAERDRAFAESKAALVKDCADWPVENRRCFADARTRDEQLDCIPQAAQWFPMPRAGSPFPSKVAACDAYGKLAATCGPYDAQVGDRLEQMRRVRLALFASAPDPKLEAESAATCTRLVKELLELGPDCTR